MHSVDQSSEPLQRDEQFGDVTLVCRGDNQMMVHKVILSSCSFFFKDILIQNHRNAACMHAVTISLAQGFPKVSWDPLDAHQRILIVLTGCQALETN